MGGDSSHALVHFGLGTSARRPEDPAGDPRGWLHAQVDGLATPADFPATLASGAQLAARTRERLRALLSGGAPDAADDAGSVPREKGLAVAAVAGGEARATYLSEVHARTLVAIQTESPFRERLVHHWSNHFTVSVDRPQVLPLAGAFEREAIRPHLSGTFLQLLTAVVQHPAMLLYLDNVRSIGPNSTAARFVGRRRRQGTAGLNENLARELLELHTLGVNGGYVEQDAQELSRVLTGWTLGGGVGVRATAEPGAFQFQPLIHEPGSRRILGRRYAEGGLEQGLAVLHDLAQHPATARHVATRLARHLTCDNPPEKTVERLARVFLDTGGHLPSLHHALVEEKAAWPGEARKFRTPSDLLHAAYRTSGGPLPSPVHLLRTFEALGQRPWSAGSPAGWPDRAEAWNSGDALLRRFEFAMSLAAEGDPPEGDVRTLAGRTLGTRMTAASAEAIARAESPVQGLALLLACPEFQWRARS